MRKIKLLSIMATVLLATTLMSAQATRTWVSGVGDDANPCSRTAPCKTFAGAISKTAPGGEIDALDPGGFGALTITKAITIDGGGGQVASVLVAGTNGIVVAAGGNDVVILRNLRFDGLRGGGNANAGLNGIQFNSGKDLNIENCVIFGFNQNAINITLNQAGGTVHVINTIMKNNGGDGLRATNATTPQVKVEVVNSYALLNGGVGIHAQSHSRIVAFSSGAENNADGFKADDLNGTNDAQMIVSNSEASFNTNGITASNGATVQVGGSVSAYNSSCGFNGNGTGNIFFYNLTNRVPFTTGSALCGNTTGIPQT